MRAPVDSMDSASRPFTCSRARRSSSVPTCSSRTRPSSRPITLERLDHVVLARTDVDADLARVLVLARPRVDRVGEAALLAHLLEQARGCRAAQDRVEDRQREATIVVAGDALSPEADVVLLGLLRVEGGPRLAARRSTLRGLQPAVARAVQPPLRKLLDLLVLEVARRRHDDRARAGSGHRGSADTVSGVSAEITSPRPITGRPSGWSPKTAVESTSWTLSCGSSSYIAISSSTTSRSDSRSE